MKRLYLILAATFLTFNCYSQKVSISGTNLNGFVYYQSSADLINWTNLSYVGPTNLINITTVDYSKPYQYYRGVHGLWLGWLNSVSTNVIGYNIYYGAASHNYTNKVFINITNCFIPLGAGQYYFAATSVGLSNNESWFGNEITGKCY